MSKSTNAWPEDYTVALRHNRLHVYCSINKNEGWYWVVMDKHGKLNEIRSEGEAFGHDYVSKWLGSKQRAKIEDVVQRFCKNAEIAADDIRVTTTGAMYESAWNKLVKEN